ncbi:MAG: hypothetical protein M3R38_37710 [Actinomycetota bacterium]|nr:hypothetical protein [Actinomycetota bacterium]
MVKTRDFVHEYRGNGPAVVGLCGVRLYEEEGGRPVVVLTQPPEDTGYEGPWLTNDVENVVAELVGELAPLAEAVRGAEDSGEEPFVVIEHVPRSRAEIGVGIAETFDLVVFSSYDARPVGSAFFWRLSLGEPDWRHCTREEAKRIVGEGLDDDGWLFRFHREIERRVPKEDAAGTEAGREPVREGRREEAHSMLPPLPWDPETGDVVLERVADFEGGLDLAGNLKHKVRTNVPWSVVEHSPAGMLWGYGGQGPADLALNILNLFEPPGTDGHEPVRCFDGEASRTAHELHQEFKARFLAGMPWEGGRISGTEIRAWISEHVVRVGGKVVGYVPRGAKAV